MKKQKKPFWKSEEFLECFVTIVVSCLASAATLLAMSALPVGARREYSATEIGNIIGVSPIAIGKWANKLGVKRDANMSYRDHDGAWRCFPEALKVFQDNALEIQDDDLGL